MRNKSSASNSQQSRRRQLRSGGSIVPASIVASPATVAKKKINKQQAKQQEQKLSKSKPKLQKSAAKSAKSAATKANSVPSPSATAATHQIGSQGKRRHPAGDLRHLHLTQNRPSANSSSTTTTSSPSSRSSSAHRARASNSPVVHTVTVTERKDRSNSANKRNSSNSKKNSNSSNSKAELSFCDEAVSTSDTESQHIEEDACVEVSAEACSEVAYSSTVSNNYQNELPPTPPVAAELESDSLLQQPALLPQPAAQTAQPSTSSKPTTNRGRGRPAVNVLNVVHKTPIVDLAAEATMQRQQKQQKQKQQQQQLAAHKAPQKDPAHAPISWNAPNSRYYRKLQDSAPAVDVSIRTVTAPVDPSVSIQPTPAQQHQQQHPLVHLSKLALQLPEQAGPSMTSSVNGEPASEPSTTPILPSPLASAAVPAVAAGSNPVSVKPSLPPKISRRKAATAVVPREIDWVGFLAQQEQEQQQVEQQPELKESASDNQDASAAPTGATESNSRRKRKCDKPMRIVASAQQQLPSPPPQPPQTSVTGAASDSPVDTDASISINFNVVPPLSHSQQSSLSAQNLADLPTIKSSGSSRQQQPHNNEANPIQVVQVSSADLLSSRRVDLTNQRARFQPTNKPLSTDPKLYHPFRQKQQPAKKPEQEQYQQPEQPPVPERKQKIVAQPPVAETAAVPVVLNTGGKGPLYRKLHDEISPHVFRAFVASNLSHSTTTKRAKENGSSSAPAAGGAKKTKTDCSVASSSSTKESVVAATAAPAKKSQVRTRSSLVAATDDASSGSRKQIPAVKVAAR